MASEIINDNGISVIAVAFFTGLFGFLGLLAKGIFDLKSQNRRAANAAGEAADQASIAAANSEEAAINSRSVSNGFAGRVDTKLDRIIERQERLEKSFSNHLEWHLDKTT